MSVLDETIPDICTAESAGTVTDEIEDNGAVGQSPHGGMCRSGAREVHGSFKSYGSFPSSAFLMFGKPYLTVHGLHIATGEVDVVCPRVNGKVARVVAATVETPAVLVRFS